MGLITGLLTLPLAPVRGVVWVGEQVQQVAEEELTDDSAIRQQLIELEELRAAGTVPEEDLVAAEDELVQRLMDLHGHGREEEHGGVQ
jgi:cytochrome c-type biogenesis protein CcmH/NrfG